MEVGLPDIDSGDAQEGQLLHTYSVNKNWDRAVLKPEQQDALRIADDIDAFIFKRVEEHFNIENREYEEGHEKEIYVLNNGEREIPGHCDTWRRYSGGKVIVISDRKFGRNPVTPADANYQLRTYSVAAADEWPDYEHIVVAIVQPRKSYSDRQTIAFYTREDIEAAREELLSIVDECRDVDAPLSASEEACRHCRAKLICKEFQRAMLVPTVLTPDKALSKTAREAYLAQKVAELDDAQLEKMLVALSLAGMIKPIANEEARNRITAGALENYKLSKASEKRDIVDPQRAIALLEIAGVATKEQILSFCSLPLGALEEKYREAHPGMTWSDARDKINRVLASVIEKHELAPKVLRK